ncbi:hypothetical protein EJ05DRAFT_479379 [Pseudovirgaria hyperparasitica]|uniref:VOC domain-containing protein n=1 Tax=Pseudovirgaria hyperparasitica TaxID=470096 RepID=A0A6A6VYK4_9PEZI|nr:uncharacterized protein EJ05DRAFT_479379 [Pseudovirgaria hyperparasitica]KAF2754387.1 hypothetical protein EJ05DRAFT_479379 [Pseudovirgaria hyperparasitica]
MAPRFTKITPSLPVSNIPSAIEYYTEILGFRLAGRDGDNHCWLQIVDDESVGKYDAAVNVYLRKRGFPGIENDVQCGKIYITIGGEADELEMLHQKLVEKKALVKGSVSVKPWGLKDATVEDHDGNVIIFNQRVEGFQVPPNTIMMGQKPT